MKNVLSCKKSDPMNQFAKNVYTRQLIEQNSAAEYTTLQEFGSEV